MVRRYGPCIGMHDDVIKWKHFPRYWPFVRGIHRSPVNSPHKGQWRGALLFSFICVWINGWVNNRSATDLKRNRAHYDVSVMWMGAGIQFISLCNHVTLYGLASPRLLHSPIDHIKTFHSFKHRYNNGGWVVLYALLSPQWPHAWFCGRVRTILFPTSKLCPCVNKLGGSM